MTVSLNAPSLAVGEVMVCGTSAGGLSICGEAAASLNEAMVRLARLEADLGPAMAALALPLRQSLTELRGHVDRAVALLTEDAMDKVAPAPGSECVDEERFARLLEIAGPDTAAELLHRMHLDLRCARDRLSDALHDRNWAEIRAQTHVLVSLAGTVGAHELHRLSETLNAAAHRADPEVAASLAPDLLGRLDALLAYVARQRDDA